MSKQTDPEQMRKLEQQFLMEYSTMRTQKGLEVALAFEQTLRRLLVLMGQVSEQLQLQPVYFSCPLLMSVKGSALQKRTEAGSCSSPAPMKSPACGKEDS